jgi:hypothetical protein
MTVTLALHDLVVLPAMLFLVAAAARATLEPPAGAPATIRVDVGRTRHTMASGIGASWHALSRDVPLDNERYAFPAREENPRGSAWGGNPPASDERAWAQLAGHARWLGLDFVRVEIDQRMYEPERDRFDWDNEEMQALYRILDATAAQGADVFLQQMWRHVEWNAWPGVHPLISAPRSLEDHARGLATLVEHLVSERRYRHIRWLSIANEPPGGTWGYWWSYGDAPAPGGLTPIVPALVAVRKELDRRHIDLPLSGPDWTDLPPFPGAAVDFDGPIGAWDIHTYKGLDAEGARIVRQWAEHAHRQGQPFLLTEFGNMALGWGDSDPGPRGYAAVLSNAEVVVRALEAGVDGLNRWSFTNRGDLDGQWQLVRTWDRRRRTWLEDVAPEPVPYYGYGLLTRFLARGSRVVSSAVEGPEGVLAAAVTSPRGRLTLFVLNLSKDAVSARVEVAGGAAGKLYLYQVEEAALGPEFRMDPRAELALPGPAVVELPPRSVSAATAFHLAHEDDGVTVDEPRGRGTETSGVRFPYRARTLRGGRRIPLDNIRRPAILCGSLRERPSR